MKTIIREQGTEVHYTEQPLDKIEACRKIVADRQFAKIDNYTVDLFTASAIVAVYDALNATNRERFVSLSLHRMASVAFKLVR